MKIFFSGGGTLGPVTPLLAMKEILETSFKEVECVWIGTKTGPEEAFLKPLGIRFLAISSGKFRRYISFSNVIDIFHIVKAFFESISLLKQEKPDICISAGGFVSVPLHLAAGVLGIPSWVHSQDVKVGLANRIMGMFATVITVTLQEGLRSFRKTKTIWLGNPVRKEIFEGRKNARDIFQIQTDLPVVLCMGGGTGSSHINSLIIEALPQLQGVCEVIHLFGEKRNFTSFQKATQQYAFYHAYDFLGSEMKDAYALSDVVVSRGGLGTLSELAALKKASIVVPKPGHQEENAFYFAHHGGVIALNEKNDHGLILSKKIRELLSDDIFRRDLGESLHSILPVASSEKIIEIFSSVCFKK